MDADPRGPVYVGPRPFQTGERLFGRDRETTALTSLLVGERVVLLYSPSGAGKTSLVQAGLVPLLRRKGFHVPAKGGDPNAVAPAVVVRVHHPPPPGITGNRYLLSTLLSLEEHRPPADRRPATKLAGLGLGAYLGQEFPAADDADEEAAFQPLVLLFDQFEEVLTLDPTDRADKEAFFREVGATLANFGRWALFAIREDHLAGLDPYLPVLPTRLTARYRLDRLERDAAIEAARKPAEAAGVQFDAAEALVDDLREVRVQRADNTFVTRQGPYVEPVHLQVVCRSLWVTKQQEWAAGRPDPARITAGDLTALRGPAGQGVDAALARYYADRVAVGAGGGDAERHVRDWFDRELITAFNTRKPVPSGEEAGHGVSRECLKVLADAYLIREETRGGTRWYELAHDRLIVPVRRDNERWRKENLTDFQKRADLWWATGQPDGLLLNGRPLAEAERWATAPGRALTERERTFLDRCIDRQRAARKVAGYRLALLAGIPLVVLVAASAVAYDRYRSRIKATEDQAVIDIQTAQTKAESEAQGKIAEVERQERLRSEARAELQARLLEVETGSPASGRMALRDAIGVLEFARAKDLDTYRAEVAVREAARDPAWVAVAGLRGPVRATAYSQDGKWFAAGFDEGRVRVWPVGKDGLPMGDGVERTQPMRHDRPAARRTVSSVAFHPNADPPRLVSGGDDGAVYVWPADVGAVGAAVPHFADNSAVRSLVFSTRGEWLVSSYTDGGLKLLVWPAEGKFPGPQPQPMTLALPNRVPITAATFPPWPIKLYAGSADGSVWWWDTTRGVGAPERVEKVAESAVSALAVNPTATLFAVGTAASELHLYPMVPYSKALRKGQQYSLARVGVSSLGFSPDGEWLGTVTSEGHVRLWGLREGTDPKEWSLGAAGTARVTGFAFSPRDRPGRWLLAGGADGTARLWDLTAPQRAAHTLTGHTATLVSVGFSPDGRWAQTRDLGGQVRFWDLRQFVPQPGTDPMVLTEPGAHPDTRPLPAVGPNGRVVALAGAGEVHVWDVAPERPVPARKRSVPMASTGKGVPPAIAGLRLGPAGELVVVNGDGSLSRWDVSGPVPRELARRPLPARGSTAGRLAIIGDPDVGPNDPKSIGRGTVTRAVFNPAGDILVANTGVFLIAPDLTATPLAVDGEATISLAVTPAWRGDTFVTRRDSRTSAVREWVVDRERRQLRPGPTYPSVQSGPSAELIALDVGPNGWLALGFADGTVVVSPEPRTAGPGSFRLTGHLTAVRAVRFTPDGRRLVTASADGTVRVWDLTEGPNRGRAVVLGGHDRLVRTMALSADGTTLLTTSDDAASRVWSVSQERLLNRARLLIGPE